MSEMLNNPIVIGTGGDESLTGGSGDDIIHGQGGSDTIFGGDGDDTLIGSAGADQIFAGEGSDVAYGGGGEDTFVWDSREETDGDIDRMFMDGGDTLILTAP